MSKNAQNITFYYSTNAEYRYIGEETPDLKANFASFSSFSSNKINWVDKDTIQMYEDLGSTSAPVTCIKVVPQYGTDLYFTVAEDIPVAANSDSQFTTVKTFKLSWKLTFLYQFINKYKNERSIYAFKRSNRFKFDPRVNIECPIVKKFMQGKQLRTIYIQTQISSSNKRWSITDYDGYTVRIPAISYYVFSEDGEFTLYPLLDGTVEEAPSRGGVRVQVNSSGGSSTYYTIKNGDIRWSNTRQHIESYASEKKTSGFVGKFLGLNLSFIIPPTSNVTSWFATDENGRFKHKYYGVNSFYGYKFDHNMWNGVGLAFDIGRGVNVGQVIDPSDGKYNFEHLRYVDLGFYKNVFDLSTLYWCINGSIDSGSTYKSQTINCKCLDTQLKGDGFYITISNNGGQANYLNYVDPEAAVFHMSNQLPVPIDTYLTWSNDNATQINANYTAKQITAAIGVVVSAVIAVAGLAAAPITGGASLGATLAAVGGIGGAIGGSVGLATNAVETASVFNQAEKKYNGNIVSGDGVDFAFYNYYLKYTDNNQGGTAGQIIRNPYVQCYTVSYFDDVTLRAINEIVYYYGYYGTRIENTYLMDRGSSSVSFTYHEYDVSNSPRLQKLIADFSNWLPNWINHNEIQKYITSKLNGGVRWWF